ncbi:MAG: hypothetical protein IPG47_15465 [Thermoflexaceae bacterium]|nr:hypothetical protein [Thermoflexaceae bacterium]
MPPAPDGETGARIAADFARVRSGGGLGWRAWLLGWLGAGPRPRTFADRLAAGVLTLAVTGGGGTAAGGGDPVAIVRDAAQLTGSAIQNLDPRQSGTTTTTATSTPAPSATPVPSQTPAPASATAQPSATPRSDDKSDDHSDDEEDTKDDSSGRKISDDGEDSS